MKLHVPNAKLVVSFKGKEILMLNKKLMDKQMCWENLELIKSLHVKRLELEEEMKATDDADLLKQFDKKYTDIEFQLQDAWKFGRDAHFHRFWDRPKCECAFMDNEDAYPTGYYSVNLSCPLHGVSK